MLLAFLHFSYPTIIPNHAPKYVLYRFEDKHVIYSRSDICFFYFIKQLLILMVIMHDNIIVYFETLICFEIKIHIHCWKFVEKVFKKLFCITRRYDALQRLCYHQVSSTQYDSLFQQQLNVVRFIVKEFKKVNLLVSSSIMDLKV